LTRPPNARTGFLCGYSAVAEPTPPSSPTKDTAAGNGRWPQLKSITGNCWQPGGRRRGSNAAGGPKSEGARAHPASSASNKRGCGDTASSGNIGWRPGVPNPMSTGERNFQFGNTGRKRPGNWLSAPGVQGCGAWNKGRTPMAGPNSMRPRSAGAQSRHGWAAFTSGHGPAGRRTSKAATDDSSPGRRRVCDSGPDDQAAFA
jgi:hypothetical protein